MDNLIKLLQLKNKSVQYIHTHNNLMSLATTRNIYTVVRLTYMRQAKNEYRQKMSTYWQDEYCFSNTFPTSKWEVGEGESGV